MSFYLYDFNYRTHMHYENDVHHRQYTILNRKLKKNVREKTNPYLERAVFFVSAGVEANRGALSVALIIQLLEEENKHFIQHNIRAIR